MFIPYDLFIQITHTVFLTHSVVNGTDYSFELPPELFDSIGVNHYLFSSEISVPTRKLMFRVIGSSMVVMNTCNGVGDSRVGTKERAWLNRTFHNRPKSFLLHIRNYMDRYSSWFTLNDSKNDLLILFSSKPGLISLGLSGEKKSFETSFL
jgi:hypothetical protein